MKRSSFIKSLIGLPAIGLINVESFTQYEKVYLKQFFVRGFSYYLGPKIIDEINKSGQLEMVREPENKFDKRAIALHFNNKKIGYLPRESNKTISILMDTELLEFHAELTQIESDASDWEKIRVAVFALKEIKKSEDLKKIEPFSELYTPNYYSLKSADDTLTRIELLEIDSIEEENNSNSDRLDKMKEMTEMKEVIRNAEFQNVDLKEAHELGKSKEIFEKNNLNWMNQIDRSNQSTVEAKIWAINKKIDETIEQLDPIEKIKERIIKKIAEI